MALTLPWSQGSIQVEELRSQKLRGAVKKKRLLHEDFLFLEEGGLQHLIAWF